MTNATFNRRSFLTTAFAAAALGLRASSRGLIGGEMPSVANPRATEGDEVHEPDWEQRLTITVGPDKADLVGRDDKVIQAAVDYVTRLGGGTVQLLPGAFTLRNAIFLPSRLRLRGSGADTVITKIASETIPLADDSDWYDQEITLSVPGGFRVGDGVVLQATNPHDGSRTVIKRTLVARSGNRFKLNDGLRENLWVSGKPTCASLFPLLTSEYTADVVIEDLTLDGNRQQNENLNGNYAGCIFLQDCNRYTIRRVEARNYNGDGISFQICHDVAIEECRSHDHAGLGLHPGSGSQRPRLVGNRLERNEIGLFWCWGVKCGLAEGNRIDANRSYGISVGHNDTDNVMRDNEITNSGKVGVLFRDESRGKDFWANRNVLQRNRIVNSGDKDGIGIDIQGRTKDLKIAGNELRETREPANRVGIRISAGSERIELADNRIEGFSQAVRDERPAKASPM
ncbi:MAG TPA: right-handed parallel beta-helix repeat-containing protein [Candidatus Anammoximicrobium sp.]|nr:right-handed parallel beta-helix repeat-containing protein [Candidatus Anammoximicrobium sp.]